MGRIPSKQTSYCNLVGKWAGLNKPSKMLLNKPNMDGWTINVTRIHDTDDRELG